MAEAPIPREELKQATKEAFAETLLEHRDLFREVFAEVLEDFALVEAMEEGRKSQAVERGKIIDLLEGRS